MMAPSIRKVTNHVFHVETDTSCRPGNFNSRHQSVIKPFICCSKSSEKAKCGNRNIFYDEHDIVNIKKTNKNNSQNRLHDRLIN